MEIPANITDANINFQINFFEFTWIEKFAKVSLTRQKVG